MIEIKGTYTNAIVFTDVIEETALDQIKTLCDQSFVENCKIRIMPDVHAGAGCVIGFTADLNQRVIPNIVGVDIGCGMLCINLGKAPIDFVKLDEVIRKYVPSGFDVHPGRIMRFPAIQELRCYRSLKDTRHFERSIGTLGGGNHFIEIDIDDEENHYLVIHTGSRNLGKQIADYYQNLAYDLMRGKDKLFEQREQIIKEYKETGRKAEIQDALKALMNSFEAKEIKTPKELCYLEGSYRDDYLHDMNIAQEFAKLNRRMIAEIIIQHMFDAKLDDYEHFETIHNYIDHENNMIRKGAVSAKAGETLLIPINMRDGSLICVGKGNDEWNCSAPHGAGRLYSRAKAKELFTVDEFANTMDGIFSTSINSDTLDECPMAYKSMEDITKNITDTVDIIKTIHPLYNFKASA